MKKYLIIQKQFLFSVHPENKQWQDVVTLKPRVFALLCNVFELVAYLLSGEQFCYPMSLACLVGYDCPVNGVNTRFAEIGGMPALGAIIDL